jgi:hypothetical protein
MPSKVRILHPPRSREGRAEPGQRNEPSGSNDQKPRGSSSVGRASAFQAERRRFEPGLPLDRSHQPPREAAAAPKPTTEQRATETNRKPRSLRTRPSPQRSPQTSRPSVAKQRKAPEAPRSPSEGRVRSRGDASWSFWARSRTHVRRAPKTSRWRRPGEESAFRRPPSSVVEHFLGKEEVTGSSPVVGSRFKPSTDDSPTANPHRVPLRVSRRRQSWPRRSSFVTSPT